MRFAPIDIGLSSNFIQCVADARSHFRGGFQAKKYFPPFASRRRFRFLASPSHAPAHARRNTVFSLVNSRNNRALARIFFLLSALIFFTACGGRRVAAPVSAARVGATEEGIASWYGEPYHGRRAANGEVFDMEQPTAAHPSLPFETWVRVRLLANRKETEVRVTDRGPFVKGRIIDLSRAAARDIELLGPGTGKVRVTVIDPPKSYLRGRQFTVQVSSLPVKARAEALQRQLAAQYDGVSIRHRSANPKGGHAEAWRVLIGRESSPARAHRILERVQARFPNAFIVPWDAE